MREKDILEILVPILCVLIVWRITPIFWTFFMTWLNRVRYLRRATPIRQLNDGEREALAFLGGPAYMLRKLVGTTDLPWKKLAHVTGKRAAVYRLQGPLDTWGYSLQHFGEIHHRIQSIAVHMPLEDIEEKTDPHNEVEVMFSRGVAIILSVNGRPTLIETLRLWQPRLLPLQEHADTAKEPHA
ncbi:hypothetical protein DN387_07865 [Pseudomonas sp. FBF18]|uniref:hypothetical protein n=1 Tax=Pseudomonas TaxID=286 RepID=UPI0006D3E354|nr:MULTISPECIES: hypothetical protein [Pseudomonas]MCP8348157.1 hypothetical protein [Pseudomonas sp. FBF18]